MLSIVEQDLGTPKRESAELVTLTIDGQNEDLDSKAALTATGTVGKTLYSIAGLSQTYKGKLTSWNRGVALMDKQRILVQDEIAPAAPVDVVWNFHTFATVAITQMTAGPRERGRHLH